jgi:YbgC/YbaW family acyl-CoA thioester hydrolase
MKLSHTGRKMSHNLCKNRPVDDVNVNTVFLKNDGGTNQKPAYRQILRPLSLNSNKLGNTKMLQEIVHNENNLSTRLMIPMEALRSRVLISREKVKFSQVDPYGHLNAARYLEFMVNHRVDAAEDQLSCVVLDLLQELRVAFVVADARVQYLRPSFCGEELEIASWLEAVSEQGFSLTVLISAYKSRQAKSIGKIQFRSVCAANGKPSTMPTSLPSRATEDVVSRCPTVECYKKTVKVPVGVLL